MVQCSGPLLETRAPNQMIVFCCLWLVINNDLNTDCTLVLLVLEPFVESISYLDSSRSLPVSA